MTYVALLRGINVGGNSKVEMAKLKLVFERLGFGSVKTYINSGNVIFTSAASDGLDELIKAEIKKDFELDVPVLVRSLDQIKAVVRALPDDWKNDGQEKCDVMFLWGAVDGPGVIEMLPAKEGIDEVKYAPGAILWRVSRENQGKSRMTKLIGTDLYKNMTGRNCNTVRRLYEMMQTV